MGLGSEIANNRQKWVEQCDFYTEVTEKDKKDSDVQVATLLTLLGAEAMDIYRSFEWDLPADKDDVINVKATLKAYFASRE